MQFRKKNLVSSLGNFFYALEINFRNFFNALKKALNMFLVSLHNL